MLEFLSFLRIKIIFIPIWEGRRHRALVLNVLYAMFTNNCPVSCPNTQRGCKTAADLCAVVVLEQRLPGAVPACPQRGCLKVEHNSGLHGCHTGLDVFPENTLK